MRSHMTQYQKGIRFAIKNYSAALMLCLKDKFDFTTEQLEQAAMHINETFDSICEGYLSLDDIAKTLKEENDINLQINGLDEAHPFVDPSRELEEMNGLNQGIPTKDFEDYQTKYLSISTDPRGDLERHLRKAGY